MHSILPLKLGVTKWYQSRVYCRNVSLDRNGRTEDFIITEAFSYVLALLLLTLLLLVLTLELIWILYLVLALALILFVLPSISFCTALQMVRRLKTSHASAAHQYAP
jgi:hypothetical protein